MNFYDVLAAEKWGGGIPTTNFFDLLFAQYLQPTDPPVPLPALPTADGESVAPEKDAKGGS